MRLKIPDRRKKHFCECDPPFHIGSGETMKSAFSQLARNLARLGQPDHARAACSAAFRMTGISARGFFGGRSSARDSVDTRLPHIGHDLRTFQMQTPAHSNSDPESPMPTAKLRASTILGAFEKAQTELVGKAVVLTDGKAGTVESVSLDEMHGLRISIRGHYGKWPISTIKFAQRG
jgi:hypothetical protein